MSAPPLIVRPFQTGKPNVNLGPYWIDFMKVPALPLGPISFFS